MTYPPQQPGPYGQPANPDPRYGAPYGSQPGQPYGQQPASAPGTQYGAQLPHGQQPQYGQPAGAPYGGQPGYGAPGQAPAYGGGVYSGGFTPQPQKKKTGLIVGIIAIVVVLLAAGGAGLYFGVIKGDDDSGSGSGSKGSSVAVPKLDPKTAIDLSKFDPCFIRPEDFAGVAAQDEQTQKPRVSVEAEGFTTCRSIVHLGTGQGAVHVTTDSGKGVDLEELSSMPKSEVEASSEGSVGILKRKGQRQQCSHIVYQGDGSGIEIEALGSGGFQGPDSKLCEAANATTKAAVAALRKNPPAQLAYPPDSYGSFDPCTVFTAQDVDAAVGVSGTKGTATPDKHTCRFIKESNQKSPIVKMEATLEPRPLGPSAISGRQQVMVGGRDSLRKSSAPPGLGAVSCDVTTAGKKWAPWVGFQNRLPISTAPVSNDLIEYPNVEVIIPGGTEEQACQAALALAEKAWAKLPR